MNVVGKVRRLKVSLKTQLSGGSASGEGSGTDEDPQQRSSTQKMQSTSAEELLDREE